MSIAVSYSSAISKASNASGVTNYPAISCNLGGATLLLVHASWTDALGKDLSATYNGVALTPIPGTRWTGPGQDGGVIFALSNPATGTHDLVLSGTDTYAVTGTIIGLTGASGVVKVAGGTESDYVQSNSVTISGISATSALFAFLVSWYATDVNDDTYTTGWTLMHDLVAADVYGSAQSYNPAGATSRTMAWGTGAWTLKATTILEVAAAATGTTASPMGIAPTSAMGLPGALPSISKTALALASTSALGLPTILRSVSASPIGIGPASAMGLPDAIRAAVLSMQGIAPSSALGSPDLLQSSVYVLQGIAPASQLGAPELVVGGTAVTLMGLGSTSALGLPMGFVAGVSTAEGIPSTSALGMPAALPGGVSVTVLGIAPGSQMGLPYDGVQHALIFEAEGIAPHNLFGAPEILVSVVVTAMGIASTTQFGLAAIPWPQERQLEGIGHGVQMGIPEGYVDQAFTVASVLPGSVMGVPHAMWPQFFSVAGVPKSSRLGRPKIRGVITYPIVIAPGETKLLHVNFLPTAVGERSGSLEIIANDMLRPLVPLRGLGINRTMISIGDGVFEEDTTVIPGISIGDGEFEESDSLSVRMKGIVPASVVGLPTVSSVGGGVSWLTADGALLKDASGQEVLLRSCNYYGLEQAGVPYGVWQQPLKTITVAGVTTEGMLDKIKRLGFNSIRQLVSVDMTMKDENGKFFTARTFPQANAWNSTFVNATLNPDLIASSDLQTGNNVPVDVITMLDRIVDHCEAIGLRVVLDMHCLAADNDNVAATQGKWYTTSTPDGAPSGARWDRWVDGARRNEQQYIDAWKFYANRYKDRPTVCGFDLINEPHNSTWDRDPNTGLVGIYERVGAAIHAINPNVLLICEGSATPPEDAWTFDPTETTGETTWGSIWSGYLNKVRQMRVGSSGAAITPNKVVYSPHEYGAEAGPTGPAWFTKPLLGKSFPDNLREVWRQQWGYLAEENIAPVWIGEFGSSWRVGDHGYTQTQRDKDAQWLKRLADYCHTFRIGSAFWGFVPDFIGGLVESDYSTVRTDKLDGFVKRFQDPMQPLDAPIPLVGGGGTGGPGGDGGGGLIDTGSSSLRLTTSGTQILDSSGTPIRLKSISWYGVNSTALVPHGLWAHNWETGVEQMSALGFNSLRFPFAGDFADDLTKLPRVSPSAIDYTKNPDLVGKTAHQVFKMILDKCHSLNMRVILDMHQSFAADEVFPGGPTTGGLGLSGWTAQWQRMLALYGNHPAVVGIDIFNEPYALSWNTWAGYVEGCANAILADYPHLLIFVQGVASVDVAPPDNFWWGGNITGAKTRPIVLSRPNRLVYSVHEYGQSTGHEQPWLKSVANPSVAGWPNNLFAMMREKFGFVLVDRMAPLWVGEFGGAFGGYGELSMVEASLYQNYAYENQWRDVLVRFLNGEYYGDGVDHRHAGEEGAGFAYWCFNGGPGQYYGLLDRFYAINVPKRATLDPLLGPYVPAAAEPSPYPPGDWYVQLPAGVTASYLAETRGGIAGTKITLTGTATASGMVYFYLGGTPAVLGEHWQWSFSSQVDAASGAFTDLYAGTAEIGAGGAYLASSATSWWAGRATQGTRVNNQIMTQALAARVHGELYSNTIASGAAVSLTMWVGGAALAKL